MRHTFLHLIFFISPIFVFSQAVREATIRHDDGSRTEVRQGETLEIRNFDREGNETGDSEGGGPGDGSSRHFRDVVESRMTDRSIIERSNDKNLKSGMDKETVEEAKERMLLKKRDLRKREIRKLMKKQYKREKIERD